MAQTYSRVNLASSNLVVIPESYADIIAEIATWETPLLTTIGMDSLSKPCTNPTHHYLEIAERPARSTLNGSIASSGVDIIVSEAVFQAGELVQVNEEIILLGTTPDNLTFATGSTTRSVGTGAGAAHADGDVIVSLGKPRAQGAASGSASDLVVFPNDVTTYSQIFSKDVVVSGTANALDRYGRMEATEKDHAESRQLKILKKELQHACLWGVAQAPSGVATAGRFDGVYERIVSTSSSDLAGADISLTNIEDAVEAIQNWGGMPDTIVCGLYSKRLFDALGPAHVQHISDMNDPVNLMYGVNVTRLYVGGAVLNILVSSDQSAHCWVLDSKQMGLGPLQGRAFAKYEMDQDGDRVKSLVLGEYTFEVANPRAHYLFSSCALT